MFFFSLLLLAKRQGRANVRPSKFDAQGLLYPRDFGLVGCGGSVLVGLDFGGEHVGFGGQVLLGHLGGDLVSSLDHGLGNVTANGLGLHDLVGPVDFGQMLAFDGCFLCRVCISASA